MHIAVGFFALVPAVLLRGAEACVPAAQTGGLGTYEYMAPEVLAHQRYSEKVTLQLIGTSVQALCTCQLGMALQWRCSPSSYSFCIRAGGCVLIRGCALGDVRPRDAIPWPQRHAGDVPLP